jgi:hypothetical protein
VLATLNGAASVVLIIGDIRLGSVTFAQHTLIMTSAVTIVGLQSLPFLGVRENSRHSKEAIASRCTFQGDSSFVHARKIPSSWRHPYRNRSWYCALSAVLLVQAFLRQS